MRLRTLAIVAVMLLASGCSSPRDEKQEAVNQSTSNVAAGIFEALVGLEQGADASWILPACKLACLAIIQAQGRSYPPAEQWAKQFQDQARQQGGTP